MKALKSLLRRKPTSTEPEETRPDYTISVFNTEDVCLVHCPLALVSHDPFTGTWRFRSTKEAKVQNSGDVHYGVFKIGSHPAVCVHKNDLAFGPFRTLSFGDQVDFSDLTITAPL